MIIMEYAHHGNLLNHLQSLRCQDDPAYVRTDRPQLPKSRSNENRRGRPLKSGVNVMENRQLMSFAWQIAKGMEHLFNMKVWYFMVWYGMVWKLWKDLIRLGSSKGPWILSIMIMTIMVFSPQSKTTTRQRQDKC